MHPNLPVLHGVPEEAHVEFVGEGAAVVYQTAGDLFALVFGEEGGRRGVVLHDEIRDDGHDEGDDTFEDEDPGPAAQTGNTVHFRNAAGEQAAERAGGRGGGEEDGHAETAFVTAVPAVGSISGQDGKLYRETYRVM